MKTASKSASSLAVLLAALAAPAAAQSLWPTPGASGSLGMFADRKAATRGDILTIVVSETAVATTSQSTKSSRESSINDAITRFIYPNLGKSGGELPGTSAAGKSGYSGGGDISNSQSLSARASVLVTDVLPNGNLVIEGVRVVTFSGETQYVVLHGLVRPDDVSPGNTVLSASIADARVEFIGEGKLTDAQKRSEEHTSELQSH